MPTAPETLQFRSSRPFTIGVEWELQLLDAAGLDLADRVLPVLEAFPDSPWIKPEFIQSCVEINSRPCDDIDALQAHLQTVVATLQRRCAGLGLALAGAGTHPFCRRLALITPLPRYLRQKKAYGYLARNQITFATHVHLGMADAETAIALMNDLRAYLPVLLALGANSPFWRGYETGFACYRQRILASGRSYGMPPGFDSWNEFCRFYRVTRKAGVFESVRDIHWDLRPRPVLGTLEVRVLDAQSRLEDVLALAAFVRCLARWLLQTPAAARPPELPRPLPWWLEKENYFQANRLGLGAAYIDAEGGVRPLRTIAVTLCDLLAQCARPDEQAPLRCVRRRLLSDAGWQRQLAAWRRRGNMQAVAGDLVRQLAAA
ncbi:glutamate---cysteine ligase/carboxylate-amine ligase [Methylomarinovum caldicuralii]|uniref:Putative glutamate--cysteine ligase 2 n=1 Tax=Methylomarinovum caldicuralii TaxID=438856 RepID=A0AAU9C2R4_9GAMM|nr:YbdK family carboxylate-amine ligase [Methylomarinovum caldicuralii]BCX81465.1 glutamate---cysteine ligase/carboxylate-amine ligase [Methylomarinovum caldicuralii]